MRKAPKPTTPRTNGRYKSRWLPLTTVNIIQCSVRTSGIAFCVLVGSFSFYRFRLFRAEKFANFELNCHEWRQGMWYLKFGDSTHIEIQYVMVFEQGGRLCRFNRFLRSKVGSPRFVSQSESIVCVSNSIPHISPAKVINSIQVREEEETFVFGIGNKSNRPLLYANRWNSVTIRNKN